MKKVFSLFIGLIALCSLHSRAQQCKDVPDPVNDYEVADFNFVNGLPVLTSVTVEIGYNDLPLNSSCFGSLNWKFNETLGLTSSVDCGNVEYMQDGYADPASFTPLPSYTNQHSWSVGEPTERQKISTNSIEYWKWSGTVWVKVYEVKFKNEGLAEINIFSFEAGMPDCIFFQYRVCFNENDCQIGYAYIDIAGAAPLPVEFTTFTAQRKNTDVTLSWTVAFEQDNKGFEILRKEAGTFRTVDFVMSEAEGGNGGQRSYTATVYDDSKTKSFYQIRQIDLKGTHTLSEIRVVNGLAYSKKITVYPNPSNSGSVAVLFGTNETRDVMLLDMNGRILERWNNYKSEKLSINNLKGGMYNMKVFNHVTNEMSSESIVVIR
jgi:Secretion system C-terminal sorting domain